MNLRAIGLLLTAACCGCQSAPNWDASTARWGAEFPPPLAVRASSPSLWPSDTAGQRRATHVSDPIARDRGDIVTVIVREAQSASGRDSKSLSQETNTEASLDYVSGVDVNKALPDGLYGGGVSSTREFDGEGSFDKGTQVNARVSTMVIDVLPNGNLVIDGSREVQVDDETKRLRVSGIVRVTDLTPSNTVLSESLAEARIVFEGEGPMTRTTERGVLGTIVDWIWYHLWPF